MEDWISANAWLLVTVVVILPCAGMLIGLVLRMVFKTGPEKKKESDRER
jgi:hypothetical protein